MRDLVTKNHLLIFAKMVNGLTEFDCDEVHCDDCPFHMVTEDAMEKFGTKCGSLAICDIMSRTRNIQ